MYRRQEFKENQLSRSAKTWYFHYSSLISLDYIYYGNTEIKQKSDFQIFAFRKLNVMIQEKWNIVRFKVQKGIFDNPR